MYFCFQSNIYDSCHDLLQKDMNFNKITIEAIAIFQRKDEAINLVKNANLSEKSKYINSNYHIKNRTDYYYLIGITDINVFDFDVLCTLDNQQFYKQHKTAVLTFSILKGIGNMNNQLLKNLPQIHKESIKNGP